ncbi:MAG TPA: DUF4382 domain-containing protein, partial [Chromatiales bacterium]|nr:DUF4382 domain-containing protein [Chromatiales bacterium]
MRKVFKHSAIALSVLMLAACGGGGGGDTTNTGSDTASTGSDTASTGSNTASTGSDTASTGSDTASTGSDTASTGSDTASTGSNTASTGSDTASTGSGIISIAVQDAPVDGAVAVNITFSQIDLHGPEGTQSHVLDSDPTTEGNQPYTVNLMDYQGTGRLQLLDGVTVPAGDYQWMRLYVDEAEIVFDTAINTYDPASPTAVAYPLYISSNAQTGLKLNRGFTVADGGATDFTIEFDLRKSVHQEGTGDYKMRPTLRLVDNPQAGNIAGNVAVEAGQACAIYAYEAGATPDDMCYGANGNACSGTTNPLTSAEVTCATTTDAATGAESTVCGYETALLAAGEYTLAM